MGGKTWAIACVVMAMTGSGVEALAQTDPAKAAYMACKDAIDGDDFKAATTHCAAFVEKHRDHTLAVSAVGLHLLALNAVGDEAGLEKAAKDYLQKGPRGDDELEHRLETVVVMSFFNRCEALLKAQGWRKAGDCFVELSKQFPNSASTDKAYFNAGIAYEKAGDDDLAIRMMLQLSNVFPDSELSSEALFVAALLLEKQKDYARSSASFIRFAKRYPQAEKVPDALLNAITIEREFGDAKAAAKYAETFVERYPKHELALHVAFARLADLEKTGQAAAALQALDAFQRRWGRSADHHHRLAAEVMRGRLHMVLKQPAKAVKAWERAASTYKKISSDEMPNPRMLNSVSEAHFRLAEHAKSLIKPLDSKGAGTQAMTRSLKARIDALKKTEKLYMEVIVHKDPHWSISSICQVGELYVDLADEMDAIKAPPGLDKASADIFKKVLSDQTAPLRDKGFQTLGLCVEKSEQLAMTNPYAKAARIKLGARKP